MKTQTFTQKHAFKTFSLFGLLLIFALSSNPLLAQTERRINGIVSDDIGPLDGATVLLKDTNTYAVTDEAGAFVFPKRLKENDVIIVSSLGYKDKVITIDSKTSLLKIKMSDYDIVIVGSLRVGNNNNITEGNTN